jgi:hypothetical protein
MQGACPIAGGPWKNGPISLLACADSPNVCVGAERNPAALVAGVGSAPSNRAASTVSRGCKCCAVQRPIRDVLLRRNRLKATTMTVEAGHCDFADRYLLKVYRAGAASFRCPPN